MSGVRQKHSLSFKSENHQYWEIPVASLTLTSSIPLEGTQCHPVQAFKWWSVNFRKLQWKCRQLSTDPPSHLGEPLLGTNRNKSLMIKANRGGFRKQTADSSLWEKYTPEINVSFSVLPPNLLYISFKHYCRYHFRAQSREVFYSVLWADYYWCFSDLWDFCCMFSILP